MGKRSNFDRVERDYYPTPFDAVVPLFAHLPAGCSFAEPCAGDGRLIRHLESQGHICAYACDIEPQGAGIERRDAFTLDPGDMFFTTALPPVDLIITNPPWKRDGAGTGGLHAMINLFAKLADTWLLFDADWMHTVQAAPFKGLCKKIVSVGRVQWIEGSDSTGMDNAAWYLFGKDKKGETEFIFRD